MLVLRIQKGQKIYINDGAITLTLTHAGSDWAKIGVDAPISVKVLRQEVCPDGPSRCCRCGGTLPPPGPTGLRFVGSTGCRGEQDSESGRCQVFAAAKAWGDAPAGPESKGGVA